MVADLYLQAKHNKDITIQHHLTKGPFWFLPRSYRLRYIVCTFHHHNNQTLYTWSDHQSRFADLCFSVLCKNIEWKPLTSIADNGDVHVSVNNNISLFLNNAISSSDCNLFVRFVTNPWVFKRHMRIGTFSRVSYALEFVLGESGALSRVRVRGQGMSACIRR